MIKINDFRSVFKCFSNNIVFLCLRSFAIQFRFSSYLLNVVSINIIVSSLYMKWKLNSNCFVWHGSVYSGSWTNNIAEDGFTPRPLQDFNIKFTKT